MRGSIPGSRESQIVFVVIVIGFVHLDFRFLPNQPTPFVCLTEDLQSRLGMRWIAFEAQHFGDYSQLLAIVNLLRRGSAR